MSLKELKIVLNDIINDYNLDIIALVCIILMGIYIFYISPLIFVTTTDAVIDTHLINVTSRASGQIVQSYISKGQEVKKGDLLMEIDPKDYENELIKLETDLEVNKEKLRMMGVEVKEDRESSELVEKQENSNNFVSSPPKYVKGSNDITGYSKTYEPQDLAQENLIRKKRVLAEALKNMEETQSLHEDVAHVDAQKPVIDKSKIDISNDTIESVKKEIKGLETQKEEVKLRIAGTRVFSPVDGIISGVTIIAGDVVNPNDVLCTITPSQVWVVARVNPEKLSSIKVGQTVSVKIPGYKYRTFKGTVSSVDKTVKVYRVKPTEEILSSGSNMEGQKKSTAYQLKIDFIEDYSDFNIPPDTQVKAKINVAISGI